MLNKNIKWFRIAQSINEIEWQQNELAIIEVNGKKVTVARVGNALIACAHKCPHAGGILADGFVDASGNIVCPLHGYKFDLKNGRNVSGEGYYLKVFPIGERDAGVFIGFEESTWLNFLK